MIRIKLTESKVILDIEQLLTLPESKTLEFKQDLSSLTPILKTIIAFANTAGGVLIIGRDEGGTLIGLKDIFKEEEKLANAIADTIYPPLLPDLEIITLQGKDLLIVKVSYWKGPFYLKKEGIPAGVYIRLGSTSRPAGPELITELQRSTFSRSFDQQPLVELTEESLDIPYIKNIFKDLDQAITSAKLTSLDILVPYNNRLVPSVGGLILFGKPLERKRFFPDARVSCARFLGDTKTNLLDHYDIPGTILDALEEALKFIARNTRLSSEITSLRRKDIPEYPIPALREVLINALLHNDYSIHGSVIQIAIFDHRLEIQNPGMLPFGFTLEDLKTGVSRIRNRVIARIFHELQLMEAWGSGYKRCIENCQQNNYPEPQWQELSSSIRVSFYSHPKTHPDNNLQAKPLPPLEENLSEREQSLLSLFSTGECLTFKTLMEKSQSAVSARTLRYDLTNLRSKGLILCKGKGRATVWRKTNQK